MSWIPLAAAGIQAGGSLLGGALGSASQASANAQQFQQTEMLFDQQQTANQHFMDQSEAYNTLMASTAYQRSMADMKAAGLNPILAAGGNVTSVGSSPMASVGMPASQVGNPGASMAAGITSAAQAGQTYAAVKAATAQADKDDAATKVNEATEKLTNASTSKTTQDEATSASAQKLNEAAAMTKVTEAAVNAAQANSANALARVNTRIAEDTERFGDSPISKAIGGLFRMINSLPGQVSNTAKNLGNQVSGATGPAPDAPKVYRRGPDGRPITDFWGNPK